MENKTKVNYVQTRLSEYEQDQNKIWQNSFR